MTKPEGKPAPAGEPGAADPAPAAPEPADRAAGRCRSCEAVLHGPFCASCGQEAHGSARSMGTLLHEVWHVLTHVDGRLWRTLGALAFRPGLLTREYLEDRRSRWLPPFRLYLVLSLLFFALAGIGAPRREAFSVTPAGAPAEAEAHRRVEEAARGLEGAGRPELAAMVRGAAAPDRKQDAGASCGELEALGGGWAGPRLAAACRQASKDGGRSLGRAFVSNVPKTMLLFLPVVALVVFALFGRARGFYVEHLVLVLHLQSALFLLFPVALAAGALAAWLPALSWLPGVAAAALWAYAAWYAYRALRVVYGEGRARTVAKALVLLLAYLLLLGATLAGTALWSVLA